MSNSSEEQDSPDEGITDDKLPEDLQATDDNPLAKPLGDEEDEESMKEAAAPTAGADPGDPSTT